MRVPNWGKYYSCSQSFESMWLKMPSKKYKKKNLIISVNVKQKNSCVQDLSWPTWISTYYTSDRYHSSCRCWKRISCSSISIYRVWRFSLSFVKQEWCSIVAELQLVFCYHLCRRPGIPSLCSHVCDRRDFTKINLKPLVQIIRQTWPGATPINSLSSMQSPLFGAVVDIPFWRSS